VGVGGSGQQVHRTRRILRISWAVCMLSALGTGCGAREDMVLKRCRELEPQVTAKAAWNDISAMQDAVDEWLHLRCDDVIARR
jgi:hypothetical protein